MKFKIFENYLPHWTLEDKNREISELKNANVPNLDSPNSYNEFRKRFPILTQGFPNAPLGIESAKEAKRLILNLVSEYIK